MKRIQPLLVIMLASMLMASCELVGDILEVGMWLGIIIVVAVIALVYWLLKKIRGR